MPNISPKYCLLIALFIITGCGTSYTNETSGSGNSYTNDEVIVESNEINVDLYYYNFLEDQKIDESIPCSTDAIIKVERRIPRSDTYIKDTLALLLQGDITDEEKSYGFNTEFPNSGFILEDLSLSEDGELKLKFADKNGFMSGGSCRVGLLQSQIEKTALQFIEVKTVVITPDQLFEP